MTQTGPARYSARVLADFEGRWRLDRDITQDAGGVARLRGTAVWQRQGECLHLVESGQLMIDGQKPITARQSYVWHPDLSVFFPDGRFFHRVPAQGGVTSHWCDPDQYDGDYDFTTWPAFQVNWRVCGPRKAYVMRSFYSRF